MKPKAILTGLAILFVISFAFTQDITFEEFIVDDNFSGPAGIWIEDLDMDGAKDIVSCSVDSTVIYWWRNGGGDPVQWETNVVDDNFIGGISVFVADLDDDQKNDVLAAGYYSDEVAWWKNEGGSPVTWTKFTISSNFMGGHEVCAFDVNKDGKMDVLGAAADGNDITWWKNLGGDPIEWEEQIIDPGFAGARSVDAGDIDGDGDIDVAGAALITHEVAWYRNEGGNPIQWVKVPVATNFLASHKVQIIDLDHDLDLDILGTAYTSGEIACWKNNGQIPVGWNKVTIDQTFGGAVIGWACDVNMDNVNDVIGSAQGSGQVAWWKYNSGFPPSWEKNQVAIGFTGVWPLHYGDIDGDGDLDLAAGGNDCRQIRWWKNSRYGVDFKANPSTGHAPVETQFMDLSDFGSEIISWEWDLDGDGFADSFDQNPGWVYTESGAYSIELKVTTDAFEKKLVKENYITVFDGESALCFNGEESFVKISAVPGLNIAGAFSLETWIKPSGWGEMASVGFGRILDKNQLSLFLIKHYNSFNDSSLVLQIKHSDNSSSRINTKSNSIKLDQWQHIAITYNGVDEVEIYINAEQVPIDVVSPLAGEIKDNNFDDLYIGNASNQAWTFEGGIDEVRMWNYERMPEDIVAYQYMCLTGNEPGLIGYWQMNEGTGDFIDDNTAYDNTGIINGADWIQGAPLSSYTLTPEFYTTVNISETKIICTPNPFKRETNIQYNLENEGWLEIGIYNLTGKKIRHLVDEYFPLGWQNIVWDGRSNCGNVVPSGIYLCVIYDKSKNKLISKKIIRTN